MHDEVSSDLIETPRMAAEHIARRRTDPVTAPFKRFDSEVHCRHFHTSRFALAWYRALKSGLGRKTRYDNGTCALQQDCVPVRNHGAVRPLARRCASRCAIRA